MDNYIICAGSLMYTYKTDYDYLDSFIGLFAREGHTIIGAYRTEDLIVMLISKEDEYQKSAFDLIEESKGPAPWYVDTFFSRT